MKLSAPYRVSKLPDYSDTDWLGRTLIQGAPDRMLWASDWPHTQTIPGRPLDQVTPFYRIDDRRGAAPVRVVVPRRGGAEDDPGGQSGEAVPLHVTLSSWRKGGGARATERRLFGRPFDVGRETHPRLGRLQVGDALVRRILGECNRGPGPRTATGRNLGPCQGFPGFAFD